MYVPRSSEDELIAETDSEDSVSSDDNEGQRSNTEHKPTLHISGRFQWDVGVVKSSEVVSSSDSEPEEAEVCCVHY